MIDMISEIFNTKPLDWINVISSGLVGLMLVIFYEGFLRKPSVKFLGVEKVETNFGELYKIKLRISSRRFFVKVRHPGQASLKISWRGNTVFAKWDESPNPLKADRLVNFIPEAVPSTYYNNLFAGNTYLVPVMHKDKAGLSIFSGWWFGRDLGYGPDPTLRNNNADIKLELISANAEWYKTLTVKDLVRDTET